MSLARWSVHHRVTVLMVIMAIVLLGGVSYTRIPISLFPDLAYPAAAVVTSYPGAAPAEVEAQVTQTVEEAVGTVPRVRRLTSYSREASSVVISEFSWGTNMDTASLDLRERLALIQDLLPDEAGDPTVVKFDPSLRAILYVSVSRKEGAGGDDPASLKEKVEESIKPEIQRIPGVAAVSVAGGRERRVNVFLDPPALAERGLSFNQVAGALRGLNVNLPSGKLEDGDLEYLLRAGSAVEDLEALGSLAVGARPPAVIPTGPASAAPAAPPSSGSSPPSVPTDSAIPAGSPAPVILSEVARIEAGPAPPETIIRSNGRPAVGLGIMKRADANSVEVISRIRAELDRLQKDHPDLEILTTWDESRFILRSVEAVQSNLLLGGLLAVAVLFFFLRRLMPTLAVALSIPIAVVATFNLLYFNGQSLNMLTLGGLALGVGMLVDNSIVVLENSYRHIEAGKEAREAFALGGGQVAGAVTASTATTLAVFLPIVFVPGLAGIMFKDLALTVTFSLLASLFTALALMPAFGSTLLRGRRDGPPPTPGTVSRRERRSRTRKEGLYELLLRAALRRRGLVLLAAAAVTAAVGWPAMGIGGAFIPAYDRGELFIELTLPVGNTLSMTEQAAAELEHELLALPETEAVFTSVGSVDERSGGGAGEGSNVAEIVMLLKEVEERARGASEVAAELRARYSDHPAGRVVVEELPAFLRIGGSPVELQLRGEDLGDLERASGEVAGLLRRVPGLQNVQTSLSLARPELSVRIKKEKAALKGFHPLALASEVQTALRGATVGRLKLEGREYDVVVSADPRARNNADSLRKLPLAGPAGGAGSLGDLAEIVESRGPGQIQRKDNQRVVLVQADLEGRNLKEVAADVRAWLPDLDLPAGITIHEGGEYQEMVDAFSTLRLAAVLALALVYMVMAAQFNSLLHPFLIMFSLPLAFIGAIVSMLLAGLPFSVPSIIGMITLAGVAVNNAIVLVDHVNHLRREGMDVLEAVVTGSRTRLRPILMTAGTTILALLPLSLRPGSGAELQQPVALVIMGGLITSTLMTLFVIPAAYALVEGRKVKEKG
ncbi:MAG: efflux RND transporter permease subunit [Firmicutes bacterium]|nr:efflux RND transporter permease subunit [Bacillota bacterium]